MIYIHHHLGLGDHIVCNGIVLHIRKLFKEDILLAVKKKNYPSVKALYKDIDIQFDQVDTDNNCLKNYSGKKILRIGFEHCRKDWEKSFYDQVGLDYSYRFSNFNLNRDLEREEDLEKVINLPEVFAFCNTNTSFKDHKLEIDSSLPLVHLREVTDNIFDWVGVILKAKEIHTVDSSIFQLIKQFNLNCRKVFYDIRKIDPTRTDPTFESNNWEIK